MADATAGADVAAKVPAWWFPTAFVQRFPDGRPLAGAGFVAGVSLYAVATILVTLFDDNGGARLTVLDLTGPHMMVVAPAVVVALLLTGNRSTAQRRSLDDWTLLGVVALAAVVLLLAVLGFVVQLTEWSSFWGTLDGLLVRAGAGISAATSGLWALGRLWEARQEERGAATTAP
ncbi:MAG TPA: hypothetical protein VFC09_12050 [Candidatus Dormibacteraeota bacterium]|nr:hypothetical protein [Candidatus Dormibacteraeota bacterium]